MALRAQYNIFYHEDDAPAPASEPEPAPALAPEPAPAPAPALAPDGGPAVAEAGDNADATAAPTPTNGNFALKILLMVWAWIRAILRLVWCL